MTTIKTGGEVSFELELAENGETFELHADQERILLAAIRNTIAVTGGMRLGTGSVRSLTVGFEVT